MVLTMAKRNLALVVVFGAGCSDGVIVIGFIFFVALSILLGVVAVLFYRRLQAYHISNDRLSDHCSLLRAFIDAGNNLIYLKDEKLRYLFVNKAFLRFYDIKEENAIIGKDDFSISKKQFARLKRDNDRAVLNEKRLITDEIRWQDHIYQTIKFPVKLVNGAYGVGALVRDITEEYNSRRIISKSAECNEILYDIFSNIDIPAEKEEGYILTAKEYDYILAAALRLTESASGIILYCEEENRRCHRFLEGEGENAVSEKTALAIAEGMFSENKNRTRGPLIANDPARKLKNYSAGGANIARMLAVPFVRGGDMKFVVALFNKPYDYDDIDVDQLSILLRGLWNNLMYKRSTDELKIALKQITSSEARLQLILDSTVEAICGIDIDGNCVFCNNSALKMLGYSAHSELIGRKIHDIIHHSRPDGTRITPDRCKIYKSIREGAVARSENEYFFRKDGSSFAVEYNSYPQYQNGVIVGAVLTFHDISKRKKAEEEIIYLSYHDPLTGLYNRRFFEQELKRLDVKRNLPLSIILGDVNGLKLTNDVFGHAAGDEILKEAANIFRSACRADDIVARWGGDEFIVILPQTPNSAAMKIADRIRSAYDKIVHKLLKYTISLGCATKVSEDEKIDWVLNRADELMYLDKTSNAKSTDYENIKYIYEKLHLENPRNKEHADNVVRFSLKIGEALGFSEAELSLLRDAAYYHDIGKIALKNIESQNGPDYRKHPTVGFRILSISEKTMEIAKYVLNHHERWDGTGYPKGLQGEAIPLLSRIVAVAEHYDNLRRNKEHMLPRDEALELLAEKAGTFFDPEIVEAFIEIMHKEEIDS